MIIDSMEIKLTLFVFILIAFCFFGPLVNADLDAYVSVEPGITTVTVGDTFAVDILLYDGGNDVTVWKIYNFTYLDAGLAELTNVEFSDFWDGFSDYGEINNECGFVADIQSFVTVGTGGSETLEKILTLTFNALHSGTLHLNINEFNTKDSDNNNVTFVISNAIVTIEGGSGPENGDGDDDTNGSDDDGNTNGDPADDDQQQNDTENQYPVVNINGPYDGVVNEVIQFSSSGSYDPDGEIVLYTWNFGDGSVIDIASPTHVFAQVGSYAITLVVVDDNGSESTAGTYVVVRNKDVVNGPDDQDNVDDNLSTPTDNGLLDFAPYIILGIFILIVSFLIIRYFMFA